MLYHWTDSEMFWTNLKEEQLLDSKKYKWTIWTNTAVKLYYDLTEEQLRLYHQIHNAFYNEVNWKEIKLPEKINIDWNKFDKVVVKVLELKDSFVTYAKLKNKIQKKLLEKIPNHNFSTVSIQKYIKWDNLALKIQKIFMEELSKWPLSFNSNRLSKAQNEKRNLEFLQLFVITELQKLFPHYKIDDRPQINSDNIRYFIENNKLVVYITDVWWDIKQLLDNYNK